MIEGNPAASHEDEKLLSPHAQPEIIAHVPGVEGTPDAVVPNRDERIVVSQPGSPDYEQRITELEDRQRRMQGAIEPPKQ